MDVRYDEAKFTQLVLHVAEHLRDDKAGGGTKLSALLFFAEFANVRDTGAPISGVEFVKRAHGPVPSPLEAVQRALVAAGDAEIVHESFVGHEQQRFVPRRAADLSVFSDAELQTITTVLADLRDLTGKQVADLSRAEPGWVLAYDGEALLYETAYLSPEHLAPPMVPRGRGRVPTPEERAVDA